MEFNSHSECICLALVFLLGACASLSMARKVPQASMNGRHEQWMARYGQVYKDETEREMRQKVFKESAERIDAFIRDGSKAYELRVNTVADLSYEDFQATRNRFQGHMCSEQAGPFRYENVSDVPSTID